MRVDTCSLPLTPALVRVRAETGESKLALWLGETLHDLTGDPDVRFHTLDTLLTLSLADIRRALESHTVRKLPQLDPSDINWLAPVESQEVWAAGVTYRRSRDARLEESSAKSAYELVYVADRPELFFKCAGWRVVPHGEEVGVRSDSEWDVPEPELAVLSNSRGEPIAFSCANDMSSRSIEGLNPLYLPQAKVYDASCSIGPAAVLAWHAEPSSLAISMSISRDGMIVFSGSARVSDMVRDPADLCRVLHAVYTLPAGAWLLTGTSIVPEQTYTARPGDIVKIAIEGIGELVNHVKVVEHSGATALPRVR